jgi:hypothetical protein
MWMEITSRIVEEELESGVSKERCDDAVLTKWRRSGIPRAFSSLPFANFCDRAKHQIPKSRPIEPRREVTTRSTVSYRH